MTDYLRIQRRNGLFYVVYEYFGDMLQYVPKEGTCCAACQQSVLDTNDGDMWHCNTANAFCAACFDQIPKRITISGPKK
jgi:hypothetical protein